MQLVMKEGQYGLMISPSRIYWTDDVEALRAFVGMYNRSQGYSVQHSDQETPVVTGLSYDQASVVANSLSDASGLPYGVVHPVQVEFSDVKQFSGSFGLGGEFPQPRLTTTDNSHNARIRMAAQLEDLARKLRSGYEVVSGGMYAKEDSLTSDIKLSAAFSADELTVEAQAKAMIYAWSGHNVLVWAEGLIRQLPENHDGRNSWLMNHAREPWVGVGTGKKTDLSCLPSARSNPTDELTLALSVDTRKAMEHIGVIQEGTIGQQVMQLVENNPLNVDELGDIAYHCLTPAGYKQLRRKLKAFLNVHAAPKEGKNWLTLIGEAHLLSGLTWSDFIHDICSSSSRSLIVADILTIIEAELTDQDIRVLLKELKKIQF